MRILIVTAAILWPLAIAAVTALLSRRSEARIARTVLAALAEAAQAEASRPGAERHLRVVR